MILTLDQIKKYVEMIECNQHTELLVEIASDFNIGFYKEVFQNVLNIHNLQGYMSPELAQFRTRMTNEMKEYFKNHLTENDYALLSEIV